MAHEASRRRFRSGIFARIRRYRPALSARFARNALRNRHGRLYTAAGSRSRRYLVQPLRQPIDERVKRYTSSVDFDRRLARSTCARPHARDARRDGVARVDLAAIERGMEAIRDAKRRVRWSREHETSTSTSSAVDRADRRRGKRCHGRSRNDQVATDLRLWLRGEIDGLTRQLIGLRHALVDLAEVHAETVMPGYTHLQVAQPVTFGHHLLAYDAMLARDMERLADCRRRVNRLPLGSAALGTSFRSTARASPRNWGSRRCARIR
jgi:argininosuccinate lyase